MEVASWVRGMGVRGRGGMGVVVWFVAWLSVGFEEYEVRRERKVGMGGYVCRK